MLYLMLILFKLSQNVASEDKKGQTEKNTISKMTLSPVHAKVPRPIKACGVK